MRQFAEQEIVLPDGPFEGFRFRVDRQPYTGLWFDAIDSGRYQRFVATGPTQSGKTLAAWVIPILYHLFEVRETVVAGVPDLDMAGDKWREDLLPVIERTRYRDLLPRAGGGSRGGKVRSIKFRNGRTLRFMSAGSRDKALAGFTARVLAVTEVEAFDVTGGTSKESRKLDLLEGRVRADPARARIYLECTVTTEKGITWQEYQGSSCSRILLPCPHCREWVLPERENFSGWAEHDNVIDAGEAAAFYCPACGEQWTEPERIAANQTARLVARGQTIDREGELLGEHPKTRCLGFRWSGVNNLFATYHSLAADEWKAARAEDEDNAEKTMRQIVWCMPYQPPEIDMTPLTAEAIRKRTASLPRGILPADTQVLVAGVDLGKWLGHYCVLALTPDGRGVVVDYNTFDIPSAELGVERATLQALRELRAQLEAGYIVHGSETRLVPGQAWFDSGYAESRAMVYQFCLESNASLPGRAERYRPTKGHGALQQYNRSYNHPGKLSATVRFIGEQYSIHRQPAERINLVEVDADHWKTKIHDALHLPADQPGAIVLFHVSNPNEHIKWSKHVTAEQRKYREVPGRGEMIVWENEGGKPNHYFDAAALARAAAHFELHKLAATTAAGGSWWAKQKKS
ncbi:MAG: phage terminase large subunit family protein [Acidobacteria bacterium]|nr:phage terminase large subunit family protein [Acidobacteriota bacterium]